MKKKLILFLFISILIYSAGAGPLSEVQVGLSYNRMKWYYSTFNPNPVIKFKRNKLYLQPCMRFSTHFILSGNDSMPKLSLTPFVGLAIFGGKGKEDTSSYKDKLAFYTMEAGIYSSIHIRRKVSLGAGLKMNYTPLILQRHYGTLNQVNDNDRQWTTRDFSTPFRKFSGNAGLIARYTQKRYAIALEAWFGMTQLFKEQTYFSLVNVFETNYRLMLGYKFAKNKKRKNQDKIF